MVFGDILRERQRLGTVLLAVITLAVVVLAAVVLGRGGDQPSNEEVIAAEKEELAELEREAAGLTTAQPLNPDTTRQRISTTIPNTTAAPTTDASVTTVAVPTTVQGDEIGESPIGETRIIRELTERIDVYAQPSLASPVVGDYGIGTPVEFIQRQDGWYLVDGPAGEGWIFGAYVVPSPDPDVQALISIDGSILEPQYADGELIPDPYEPGKYALGFNQTDGNRTLIFLPDGLVVYVPTNKLRPVQ